MQVNTYRGSLSATEVAYVGLQSNLTLTCGMSFHQITAALNYPGVIGLTILNM